MQKAPASLDPAAEAALLTEIARGNRQAFERLYGLYYHRLARFLQGVMRRGNLAEEVINDTMLVVWQHAAEFRAESAASTWIFGIAYRRALKTLSRETQRLKATSPESLQPPHLTLQPLADRAELADWLDAALARLSPEHRLVIELAYVVGLSCEEIAGVAECPVSTVKTRMFYARLRLRENLAALAAPAKQKVAPWEA
jgi:RNA polymerase sigma-70 factor, ECF subfamily